MIRQALLLAALNSAEPWTGPKAAEGALAAADRVADLALKICLTEGSERSVTITGQGDSLDVKGSPGTITVKRTEARGLVGGLSPAMTRVLAEQASEARACTQAQFSALSQKLWIAAGAATRPAGTPPPMVRYVDGDHTETVIIGQIPAVRDVLICVQRREGYDAWEVLNLRLVRTRLVRGEPADDEFELTPTEGPCRADNKPGYGLRAHALDAGQYSLVTYTSSTNGLVGFFEHHIGRPERKAAKWLFGIPYVNLFTLEIRVE